MKEELELTYKGTNEKVDLNELIYKMLKEHGDFLHSYATNGEAYYSAINFYKKIPDHEYAYFDICTVHINRACNTGELGNEIRYLKKKIKRELAIDNLLDI